MNIKHSVIALAGASALALSASSFAASIDVVDAYTGQSGTAFLPEGAHPLSEPYIRGSNQNWGWEHGAISDYFQTASLNVSGYDVDAPYEIDNIYAFNNDNQSWDLLGSLSGVNNEFAFTTFRLDRSWFDEISSGLQVAMEIDLNNAGWRVSLAKSVISLDGAKIGSPLPMAPSAVPAPAAAFLFAPALLGFMGLRRKAKNAQA